MKTIKLFSQVALLLFMASATRACGAMALTWRVLLLGAFLWMCWNLPRDKVIEAHDDAGLQMVSARSMPQSPADTSSSSTMMTFTGTTTATPCTIYGARTGCQMNNIMTITPP